jgi:hypothetical protein
VGGAVPWDAPRDREADRSWLTERGVTLIGADLDESPIAYRRLPEVLAHHAGSVRVPTSCGRSPW